MRGGDSHGKWDKTYWNLAPGVTDSMQANASNPGDLIFKYLHLAPICGVVQEKTESERRNIVAVSRTGVLPVTGGEKGVVSVLGNASEKRKK